VLTPDLILNGYRHGIFPMAINKQGDIGWFSPDPRALIPLDDRFHVPHGLKRTLRKNQFQITVDTEFEAVITACSKVHGQTWISNEIIVNYCELHRLGYGHSIEVRTENQLAGGLYGVALGGVFFGESMFHRVSDASKCALVALVQRLRERAFVLLDTQWMTSHLRQFGTFHVPKEQYLAMLEQALALERTF
jgi:leucyl/phenylalanyl-tRNA--protein transferase